MLSSTQCSNSVQCEKAIVDLNQFFFAAQQFFQIVWAMEKDRGQHRGWKQDMQIEEGGLSNVSTPLWILLVSDTKKQRFLSTALG